MSLRGFLKGVCSVVTFFCLAGCDPNFLAYLPGDLNQEPDAPLGFDTKHPNVERTVTSIDFDGVDTIRLEMPVARVVITQSDDADASIDVTEVITLGGVNNEKLKEYLVGSEVTAERSFVDDSRLDIEATLADGLTDQDIVFYVRLVVPSGANSEIILGAGPVEVASLAGNVEIRTTDGSITVSDVTGNIVAKTTTQAINIAHVSGNVQAETTEANVTLELTPAADGQVFAKSTTGAITLKVAKSSTAELLLVAVEGSVSADLSGFAISDVTTSAGFFQGTLNGGGGTIKAQCTSGGTITFEGM